MARKKRRGGGRSGWRKMARKIGGAVGSILILGPVWVPAIDAATQGGGDPQETVNQYVFSLAGYSIRGGNLDQSKLQQVVVRDAVLVGAGLFAKWLARRA